MSMFAFVVPFTWKKGAGGFEAVSWMDAAGARTEDAAKAIRFRFRLHPTGREETEILRQIDDLNGGMRFTVDLDLAISQHEAQLRAKVIRGIYPNGVPEDLTAEQVASADAAFARAWDSDTELRPSLEHLQELKLRQRVLAEWKILQVRDPNALPTGWEDLAERAMPPAVLEAVLRAYKTAKADAAEAVGKPQPSER